MTDKCQYDVWTINRIYDAGIIIAIYDVGDHMNILTRCRAALREGGE